MSKHVTVITTNDSHLEVRGELMFDPQEGTLTILSRRGSYMTFNWDVVEFFIVNNCDDDCDHDEDTS